MSDDNGEERREAIKEAAIEQFAEHGYRPTKVSDIVEDVGVAQGTFYLHYGGKEELFEEILDDFLSLLLRTISGWEPEEIDSRETLQRELKRVGLELTDVIAERQGLATIYFKQTSGSSPEFASLVRDFHDALVTMLTEFNKILHERGLIADADFRILANMTVGMVERIALEYIVFDSFEDVAHEEIVDHLVGHFMDGTSQDLK